MTCGQNFEHGIFFEMSLENDLSKFCHAKIRKKSVKSSNGGPRVAATVSDRKIIPETVDSHW